MSLRSIVVQFRLRLLRRVTPRVRGVTLLAMTGWDDHCAARSAARITLSHRHCEEDVRGVLAANIRRSNLKRNWTTTLRFASLICIVTLAGMIAGCDDGLRPADSVVLIPKPPPDTTKKLTGISGVIHFRGTRPSPDSLVDLRVVAFVRKYPLDSIASALFSGQAMYGDSVPRFVDTATYVLALTPRRYTYITIGQQWGPSVLSDWRAVGVFAPSGNDSIPGAVDVVKDSVVPHIDIVVDYDHLPPP